MYFLASLQQYYCVDLCTQGVTTTTMFIPCTSDYFNCRIHIATITRNVVTTTKSFKDQKLCYAS